MTHKNEPQILENSPHNSHWPWWPLVPIYPYAKRQTIRQEIVRDRIWTFDQLQGILYVVIPIRMTIIKLDQGGLLVYAPIAPTPECLTLINQLIDQHGPIKYIILPTISGLEHKVFVPPFARQFPQAQIFIPPHQWSFPLNLPLTWLGFPPQRTHILPQETHQTPFADQFDYTILKPIELGTGKFSEVAFLDKTTQTLLLTDTLLSIPPNPPPILQLDPYPLLFHAKDHPNDIIEDNHTNRQKGWQRICLFAMYFRPSVLKILPWSQVFTNTKYTQDKTSKNYFGLYPFHWQKNWQIAFQALQGNGRPFVAPILQTLILNRAPQSTLHWVNHISQWNFQRIIPCHFDAPIPLTPQQFRQTFCFLEKYPPLSAGLFSTDCYPLPPQDFQLLRQIDQFLSKTRIVPPPQDKI